MAFILLKQNNLAYLLVIFHLDFGQVENVFIWYLQHISAVMSLNILHILELVSLPPVFWSVQAFGVTLMCSRCPFT